MVKDHDNTVKRVFVFDICNTLYYSNTTHDFVSFCLDKDRLGAKWVLHFLINSRYIPIFWLILACSKLTGIDFHKMFNLRFLAGLSKPKLDSMASEFVNDILSKRMIDEIHGLLNSSLRNGDDVILCSASIEPVVNAVARRVGVEKYICTRLEFIEDRFVGRSESEVGNNKLLMVEELLGGRTISFAVSDNKPDLSLLLKADQSLAIVYSEVDAEFWDDWGIETIKFSK